MDKRFFRKSDLFGKKTKGVMPRMHSCKDIFTKNVLFFQTPFQIVAIVGKADQIRSKPAVRSVIDLFLFLDPIDDVLPIFSFQPL